MKTAQSGIGTLFGAVLNTKIQRKAKDIVMTCVQFIFTSVYLILNNREGAGDQNENVITALKIITGFSIAYAISLAIFILIHALRFGDDEYETYKEIEDAYKKTNTIPLVDSVLEIPLAMKFKGNLWWLVLIIWVWFVALSVACVIIIRFQPCYVASKSTTVAATAGVLQLY